jgi:hypothetical protein
MEEVQLGDQSVTRSDERRFTPKPPEKGAKKTAILVSHGMGQQVPFETIDGVVQAVYRGLQALHANVGDITIKAARLGSHNLDEEPELVRAELTIGEGNGKHEVHVYEAYWAPITEGKVNATDVVRFLFFAGWNGIKNTILTRSFQRWMFKEYFSFPIPISQLFGLATLLVLLVALVFINSVVAAAAASHAIGAAKTFPSGLLLSQLTWDLLVVDAAALFIWMGLWRWLFHLLAWLFLSLGAFLVIVGAVLMAGHLAEWEYFVGLPPGESWQTWVAKWPIVVLSIWVVEFWAVSRARNLLIQYVGDVAAYVSAHAVSKFWEVRQQIWKMTMKVARAVYGAKTADGKGDFYGSVIVVGHSLGSVIGYDILNGLMIEDGFSAAPLNVADRTRMFLTFGSPLDKIAFLFRTFKGRCSMVREVGSAAIQPMIAAYAHRPKEWVNLWSSADIISGELNYYDDPGDGRNSQAVSNLKDDAASTPLVAHVQYWDGDMFAEHLARAITSETPHKPKRNLAFARKVMNRTQRTKDRRTAKSTNGGTVKEAGPDTSSA